MNKIYRTVYNETTGTWVAVEETAKSHRKSNGVVNETAPTRGAGCLKKFSIAAAVAALVSPFVAGEAQAEVMCKKNDGTLVVIANGRTCLDAGYNKLSNLSWNDGKVESTGGDRQNDVAWGKATARGGNATAWGSSATLAEGSNTTAFGQGVIARGFNSTAWGYETQTDEESRNATAFGKETFAAKERSTAFGWKTQALKDQATAFGQESIADGVNSTAFGLKSKVYADNALGALGGIVNTGATNSAAIGGNATVSSANAYVIGQGASINTGSSGSVALGGQGTGDNQTTIGTGATNSFAAIGGKVANGATGAVAVGNNAQAKKQNAIAVGSGSLANSTKHIAIGTGATTSDTLKNAMAIGNDTFALGVDSIAVGGDAYSRGNGTVSLGGSASAKNKGSIAIGHNANSGKADEVASGQTIAIGQNTNNTIEAPGAQSIAIGAETVSQGIASIAIGGDDIVTVADDEGGTGVGATTKAGGDVSMAIGMLSQSDGDFSQVIGYKNTTSDAAKYSLAAGYKNSITGENATAVGQKNTVSDEKSIAVGYGNNVSNSSISVGDSNIVSGKQSIAVGYGHNITGDNSGAFGDPSNISGSYSYATGNNNTISADNSFVVGNNSTVSTKNTYVIGSKVTGTTKENSVFLGDESAYVEAGTGTTMAINKYDADYTIGTATYKNEFAAQEAVGVVSVGAGGKERRIQNVSAGFIGKNSTDAINGSQLYQAYEDLQWQTTVTADGGKVEVAIDDPQVIGKYSGSLNQGNVNFKAGKGIEIETANSGSLDMTFKVRKEDGHTVNAGKIEGGTDDQYWDSTQVASAINDAYWVASDKTNQLNVKPSTVVNWTGEEGVTVSLDSAANTFTAKLDKSYLPTVVGDDKTAWVTTRTDGNHTEYKVQAVDTIVKAATGGAIEVTGGAVDTTTKQRTYTVDLNTKTKDEINKKLETLTTAYDSNPAQTLDESQTQADFFSGKNITLSGDSSGITIATEDDVSFNSVETKDLTVTGDTNLGGNTTISGPTTITGDTTYAGNITNDEHIVNKKYADELGWSI
ncbi:MAG: hypothetical protein IKZ88_10245, partial [Neisseriaceae bacterium]|nr:hypothetical protein [Neisseriaceae bacterium]